MFKRSILSAAAFMFAIVAASSAGAFCFFLTYEPDAPACLKKEL